MFALFRSYSVLEFYDATCVLAYPWPQTNLLKFNIQPLFIVCTRILNCVSYEMCKQYLSKYKLQWQKAFYSLSFLAFLAASVSVQKQSQRDTLAQIYEHGTACSIHLERLWIFALYVFIRTHTHTLS